MRSTPPNTDANFLKWENRNVAYFIGYMKLARSEALHPQAAEIAFTAG